MNNLAPLAWFSVLITVFVTVRASIHEVHPGNSIQSAVNMADHGDTVLLHEGTYSETVILYGKTLTIGSGFLLDEDSAHIANTVLRPDPAREDTASCLVYCHGEALGGRVVGLTMKGGRGTFWLYENERAGGGAFIFEANARFEHCVFDSCYSERGGAIAAQGYPPQSPAILEVVDSRVSNCGAALYGGGIFAFSTILHISGSDFYNDSAALYGGGLITSGSDIELIETTFRWCKSLVGAADIAGCDGGVTGCLFEYNGTLSNQIPCHLAMFESNCSITGNTFRLNVTPTSAVWLTAYDNHHFYFGGNLLEYNTATIITGTLLLYTGSGEIAYNVFRNNVNHRGGAVQTFGESSFHLHHNVFRENVSLDSTQGSVLINLPYSNPTLDSNLIVGNYGLAISNDPQFTNPINAHNNWWGNASGPYHPTLNPSGTGDTLYGDEVIFEPWLTSPPDTVSDVISPRPVSGLLATWELISVYPNPFNSGFAVTIAGFASGDFELALYNLLGRQVALLHSGKLTGTTLRFSAPTEMATGIYFLRASDSKSVAAEKLLLLK